MADTPKKSGLLQWILIGCGTLTFIGLLGCGGCVYFAGNLYRSHARTLEQAHEIIRTSPIVVTALGEIRGINMGKEPLSNLNDAKGLRIEVQGARAKGEVMGDVEVELSGIRLKTLTLVTEDGKRFPLK